MHRVHVPHMHFEVLFSSGIVCLDPIFPSFFQFIPKQLQVHIHILPRIIGPWNYQRQKYVISLHNLPRGEIEWNDKYMPTTVLGCRHAEGIKTIRGGADSTISWICRFILMQSIEMFLRFPIRCVYHHLIPIRI